MDRRTFLTAAAAVPLCAPALATNAPIKLRDLYDTSGGFSELALGVEGTRITVEGFMAPPHKEEAAFFVLTKMPMSDCPVCETAAEWPVDILAVYTKSIVNVLPYSLAINVNGVLEMGEVRDPETGFVSLLRLTDATYG